MKKQQNIFITFLELLNIKHTKRFSNQYFNKHPHKYNLFGLSNMLSEYGIQNTTAVVVNKEDALLELESPFIAHLKNDFVIVHKIESGEVSFWQKGINYVLGFDKFIEVWTGVVLVADPSEKSIEPNYAKNKELEQQSSLKKRMFCLVCIVIVLFRYFKEELFTHPGISLLMLINLFGIFISWLLLSKQVQVQNHYAEKICSLFKQKNCYNVLESNAAKVWGGLSWSEIGLGYFAVNLVVILFLPSLISSIVLVNILILPYTFWSVWYQAVKIRQWCILCLIIQALLWGIFIISCVFENVWLSTFGYNEIWNLFLLGCCYFVLMVGINMLVPKFYIAIEAQKLEQSLSSLKANADVFVALLKKQPFYGFDLCNSVIHFGSLDAPLQLTVISDPYCHHCSSIHKDLEQLLLRMGGKLGICYVLSSFSKSLSSTNKYLIAAYLENRNDVARQIFEEWFDKGREQQEDFFKTLSLNLDNPEVEVEFQKHESWRTKYEIQAVPTVLVNGYLLPEAYKVEDLQYFKDLII